MAEFVLAVPDVGEGVAEVELVEWHVKPGDPVREDMVLAEVMTDKATVEIPSPVSGRVIWIAAEKGDTIAVKAPLLRIALDDEAAEKPPQAAAGHAAAAAPPAPAAREEAENEANAPRHPDRPQAAPAVRKRAQDAGIDLAALRGTGPQGRITHADLDAALSHASAANAVPRKNQLDRQEIKLSGLRRRIAEKMTLAARHIPHITYVEEVDVTALEDLRAVMNRERGPDRPKLTVLPFLMRAMARTIAEQPAMNATFDDEAGIITRHDAVHIGVATQTPAGLAVPVLRHVENRTIWDCAAELGRLAETTRSGKAGRDELTGSTITVTSLGPLGGIVSTPVINQPEIAIVGVNRIVVRPLWQGERFVPRKMMNLSSSFDHRIVDGWDAAIFIQRIKALLETPALLFVD